MNKTIFLMVLVGFMGSEIKPHVYLWEQMAESGPSCCLHFDGSDICNPNTACQHYMEWDLVGIVEYASRLLSTERGTVEPYHTNLVQVSRYIRKALSDPYYTVSYKLDQHRSVQFYHELIDAALKSKDKGAAKGQVAKQQPKQDYLVEYLTKMGLYIPHKKNNKL